MAKPVPIQPGPAHSGVAIAPNMGGRKTGGGGLTIRTSRHWVLPPRPKPGRKPSYAAAGAAEAERKKTGGRRSTKAVLRKEIQQLRLENVKLKKELERLVASLQELKRRFTSTAPETPAADIATPVSLSATPEASKKRGYVEDSTDAFLKFEDEDGGDVPALATACMAQSLSLGSRASFTDDEDFGSTPSSLFSSDLQNLSAGVVCSALTQHVAHSPRALHSGSPSSSTSSTLSKSAPAGAGIEAGPAPALMSLETLTFLDNYERTEFYSKHTNTLLSRTSTVETPEEQSQLMLPLLSVGEEPQLQAIREEDDLVRDPATDAVPFQLSAEDEQETDGTSILNFLKTHMVEQEVATDKQRNEPPALPPQDLDRWVGYDDPLQLMEKRDLGQFIAPSLEELMEEQDDCDRDSKLLGPLNYDAEPVGGDPYGD
ncbi:AaceriABL047Wp [[Ashbya] aceris (nom. inval.)]|nr:AaceriABL047Wp [[Ashbya] aceris (nom. inval.)]